MNAADRTSIKQAGIRRLLAVLCCIVVSVAICVPTALAQQWQEAYPGVRYLAETRPGPVEVRAAEVDLCAPGVSMRATTDSEKWQATSSFGSHVGADVAINGDFYTWDPSLDALGLAMGSGDHWSGDTQNWGFVAFGAENVEISPPGVHVPDPPGWMEDAVGGNIMVLTDGVTTNDQGSFCTTRHPRTVVGLSQDESTFYMVAVDGRAPGTSIGMTCAELGDLMRDLGAHDALNLDGGGSTTMWRSGVGVVNSPSDDGGERTVLNHLAVRADGSGPAHSCPEQDWDIDIDTNFLDLDVLNTDGDGDQYPDVFPGDEFQAEILVSNQSSGVIRDVWAGYWFEHPYLAGIDATIYTDHPEYDQQTWVENDANVAPENPDAGEYGQDGHLNLYAFSPGETKRIVVDMEATQSSIGHVDHPDIRAWVHNIEDIYESQEGFWDEPDDVNHVGETLRAYSELDVLSRDHWHFAAPDDDHFEGWRRCDGGTDGLHVDTDGEALVVEPDDVLNCINSPAWTGVDADALEELVIATGPGEIPAQWTIEWSGSDAGFQDFEVGDSSGDEPLVFPLGNIDAWTGTVDEFRIAVDVDEALAITDIYFQSGGETTSPYADVAESAPATPSGDAGGGDDTGTVPGGTDSGGSDSDDSDAGTVDAGEGDNGLGGDDELDSRSRCASVAASPGPGLVVIVMLLGGLVGLRRIPAQRR